MAELTIEERQLALNAIGYDVPVTGKNNDKGQAAYQNLERTDKSIKTDLLEDIDAALRRHYIDRFNKEHQTSIQATDEAGVKSALAQTRREHAEEMGLLTAANHFQVEHGGRDSSPMMNWQT